MRKQPDKSPFGCCGGFHLETGAVEAGKASAKPGYLPPISESAYDDDDDDDDELCVRSLVGLTKAVL